MECSLERTAGVTGTRAVTWTRGASWMWSDVEACSNVDSGAS